MILPKSDILSSFIMGAVLSFVLIYGTIGMCGMVIVPKSDYQKLQQHCTAADSLINSINTDYVLDVLSEMPIYDEYIETK